MKQLLADRGATLIEQLMALLMGSGLIIALYSYFRAELYQALVLETRTATLEDGRAALDIMMRDLKESGSWGTGSAPAEIGGADDPNHDADTVCNRIYAASASLVHVQMDLNGNGDCADTDPRENIRYEMAGPTSTCAGPNTIRRNGDCLVANVVPLATGKIFTFFDANGNDLGNTPALEAIKRIKVAFSIQVKHPDPGIGGNMSAVLSTSVELRN